MLKRWMSIVICVLLLIPALTCAALADDENPEDRGQLIEEQNAVNADSAEEDLLGPSQALLDLRAQEAKAEEDEMVASYLQYFDVTEEEARAAVHNGPSYYWVAPEATDPRIPVDGESEGTIDQTFQEQVDKQEEDEMVASYLQYFDVTEEEARAAVHDGPEYYWVKPEATDPRIPLGSEPDLLGPAAEADDDAPAAGPGFEDAPEDPGTVTDAAGLYDGETPESGAAGGAYESVEATGAAFASEPKITAMDGSVSAASNAADAPETSTAAETPEAGAASVQRGASGTGSGAGRRSGADTNSGGAVKDPVPKTGEADYTAVLALAILCGVAGMIVLGGKHGREKA